MANHGPVYGLSRELQMKNQARFNLHESIEVLDWIQACTGIKFEVEPYRMTNEGDVADALRTGVQLCVLAERIMGRGSVQYIKNPKMPFHMMENISKFLEAIKHYGVPEISCFQTVDLYERKQLYKVIECLRAFAAVAEKRRAPVPVAKFAVKIADEQPRNFSPDVLNQSHAVIALQYGSNKGASQKGMTPYGLGRQILPDGK